MGISGGLCALSHYDARTRLVSLPNTGAGPDSERGLQHTIPIQREREELSYDFIPPSAHKAGQGARSPSLSSPFRLRLWWSAASTVRFVYRSGPSARPTQTLHGTQCFAPLTVTEGDHF